MISAATRTSADTVLDVIVEALVQHAHAQRVILFGSRARSDARSRSDYDLLVVIDSPELNHLVAADAQKCVRQLAGAGVDVQVVARKPGEFEARQDQPGTLDWDVAREGIVLWPRPALRLPPRPGLTSTAMLHALRVRERPAEQGNLPAPETIAAWIERADDDLRVLEDQLLHDRRREVAAWSAVPFHAHQAAEKYLKVLLIERGVHPPRTHKLEELLDTLTALGLQLASLRDDCLELSAWAVDSRYPENVPFPTAAQGRAAAQAALRVVAAARSARK